MLYLDILSELAELTKSPMAAVTNLAFVLNSTWSNTRLSPGVFFFFLSFLVLHIDSQTKYRSKNLVLDLIMMRSGHRVNLGQP